MKNKISGTRFRYPHLLFLMLISLLASCEKEEVVSAAPSSDLVTVMLNPSFSEEVVINGNTQTRSGSMLDPGIENPIFDIWVIQYADGGVILKSEHLRAAPGVLGALKIEPFPVELYARANTTVCLVANLQPGQPDATYPWAGSLNGFKRMMLDLDLNNSSLDVGHIGEIRMFGYYFGDIATSTYNLNVTLGRMISRVALDIRNTGRFNLTNVDVEITNVPRRIPFFPTGDPLPVTAASTPAERDEYFTTYRENIGNLNVGASQMRYYYMGENINPQETEATTVKITGTAEGVRRSTTVVLGGDSPGAANRNLTLARNYGYVFGIKLMAPRNVYTDLPKNPAWSVPRNNGVTNAGRLVDGTTTNTSYATLGGNTNTYFVIDMKEQKTFNYIKFLYNGNSLNYRVSGVVVSGSNSTNTNPADDEFTVLETVSVSTDPRVTRTPVIAELTDTYNYRFVKIQFSALPNNADKRIVEFYLGNKTIEY